MLAIYDDSIGGVLFDAEYKICILKAFNKSVDNLLGPVL